MTDRLAELGALQYAVENLSTAGTNPNRLGLAGYIHAAYTDYQTWAAANPGVNPDRLSARGRLYGYFYDNGDPDAVIKAIFANSEVGAWYDPSDLTTMFQSSSCSVFVTADGQSVGRIFDKSKGLVLGNELISNGDFSNGSTGWTLGSGWSVVAGEAVATTTAATTHQNITGAPKTIKISFDVVSISGSVSATYIQQNNLYATNGPVITTTGSHTCYLNINPSASSGLMKIQFGTYSEAQSVTIDNVTVKEVQGNHAIQATVASMPIKTSSGASSWIKHDGVDDSMGIVFASSLGSDCTVARAVVGGSPVILTGQTIGTTYSISTDHAGYVIVDRALTTQETSDVIAYLTAKGAHALTSAPSFVLPANQTIFTVSTANAITLSRNAEVYADSVDIGYAFPSLSWTPGSVDLDVSLEAIEFGTSYPVKVCVAGANAIQVALSGWSTVNATVASNESDYSGGTTAFKITAASGTAQHYISKTPSPSMTNGYTGFEITVKAGTNSKIIVYITWSSGNRKAIYDITSKQSFCELAYIKEVQDMGNGYKRLWCGIADAQIGTGIRLYHTNTFDPLNSNTTTMAGTETFYALNPRITDGPLPLTNYQKCGFWESGTTSFGAKRWTLTTEFNTSVTQMGQAMYIDVLLPDSYSASNQYRVVYLMPVENANGTTLNNELEEVEALGFHNSMDCIFVRPYFMAGGNRTWGGVKNDGTINHDAYISDMLPGFMAEFYSVNDTREGRTIFGYSAGAFAALTQAQRRPDVWGYCCAWDAPWTEAYATFDQAQHFGTEAQYNLFHPYQNFASLKTAFTDKARLIVGGSFSFADDTTSMYSRLVTELGNPLNNGGGDYATTITDTNGKWWKLDKTESAHDFIPGWVTPAMSALQTLWNR